MKKFLILLSVALPIFLHAQEIEGKWYASFAVMGTPMRMNLDVTTSPLEVTVSNPDMIDAQIKASNTSLENHQFFFELSSLGLEYTGTVDRDSIVGEMQQNGLKWKVTFQRQEQNVMQLNRPQEPKPPFDYTTDSLQIENGDISIGATLVLPKNFDKTTPILILSSGSGAQNRDCEIAGHKPFWVIADHLARNNIATIRFDDRGTGTSTGNYNEASLMDLASDVEAIAGYVRKKLKYKKNPLGMLGHSEGGMHTLIAANNNKTIDFLIQMATSGTSGENVLVQQQYDIPKAEGQSDAYCAWNMNVFQQMSTIVLTHPQDIASDSLTQFLADAYDNAPEDYDKTSTSRLQFIMGNIRFMNNQWMREFLAFEAAQYFKKLEKRGVMMLAIHGEKDVQVAPEINSAGFDDYEYAELYIVEGLNHLMQRCNTCSVTEYGDLEETISPTVLDLMAHWIQGLY